MKIMKDYVLMYFFIKFQISIFLNYSKNTCKNRKYRKIGNTKKSSGNIIKDRLISY